MVLGGAGAGKIPLKESVHVAEGLCKTVKRKTNFLTAKLIIDTGKQRLVKIDNYLYFPSLFRIFGLSGLTSRTSSFY